jgi:hypothetical protein
MADRARYILGVSDMFQLTTYMVITILVIIFFKLIALILVPTQATRISAISFKIIMAQHFGLEYQTLHPITFSIASSYDAPSHKKPMTLLPHLTKP